MFDWVLNMLLSTENNVLIFILRYKVKKLPPKTFVLYAAKNFEKYLERNQ